MQSTRLSCAAIVTPLLMLESEEDDKAYSKGGVEAANKKGGSDQTRLTHGLRKFSFRNLVHKFFRDPPALRYLTEKNRITYDIPLQVALKPEGDSKASVISKSNFKYLYWTVCQQLAHHTINGCNLNPGDLLASGTISGPDSGSLGSMLEMSMTGKKEIVPEHGGVRKFYKTVIKLL